MGKPPQEGLEYYEVMGMGVLNEEPNRIPCLSITLPICRDVYMFRVPSTAEYTELMELHAQCEFVGQPIPWIEWMCRQLIHKVNDRRVKDFEFYLMHEEDVAAIQEKVRGMLVAAAVGHCCVCGVQTDAPSVAVCDRCFGNGWGSSQTTINFRTELGISRVLGTNRWARRGDEVSYLDDQSNIRKTTLAMIDQRLRGVGSGGFDTGEF